jgi:aspartyl protease family protein
MLMRVVIIVAVLVGLAGVAPMFMAPSLDSGATMDSATASSPMAAVALEEQSGLAGPGGSGRAVIEAARDGHYYADATIRGRRVPVVVDTGATVVALNLATARALGIAPPLSAFSHTLQTANGSVDAALVTLAEVRLGGIRVRNVQAVILPDSALDANLLGMSFLGSLSKWQAEDGRLELIQ